LTDPDDVQPKPETADVPDPPLVQFAPVMVVSHRNSPLRYALYTHVRVRIRASEAIGAFDVLDSPFGALDGGPTQAARTISEFVDAHAGIVVHPRYERVRWVYMAAGADMQVILPAVAMVPDNNPAALWFAATNLLSIFGGWPLGQAPGGKRRWCVGCAMFHPVPEDEPGGDAPQDVKDDD
jgi:hypothetical protein